MEIDTTKMSSRGQIVIPLDMRRDIKEGFIEEIDVKKVIDLPVHQGEKAAISLCLEKKINIFLSDDGKARRRKNLLD